MKKRLVTIDWKDSKVIMIDQNALPEKLEYKEFTNYEEVAEAIEIMTIRGAPAIGAAAALGLALAAQSSTEENINHIMKIAAERLAKTRPTAVNLFWAIERIRKIFESDLPYREKKNKIIQEAVKIREEDIEINKKMGAFGQQLIDDGDTILTHCNAGGLATVEYGTALGVIRAAWENNKKIQVFADETRPRLQGAKLTAFELHYEGIPVTVISDNMAGSLMATGKINKIVVGADRIVKTGHVFNKIGTYSVAVLANYHKIPFYVAAPQSTFDMKKSYDEVIIEERSPREMTHVGSTCIVPEGVKVINPAFDMTPPELVTAIITEKGIIYPPYLENIKEIFR
ncbi:MAG: S-methyl-5-thioribose-1-phosphate isomerase [Candidatus Helarchaeota archaeon]